jgi:3-methyladenine DNA glycosylase AlkD
MPRSLSPPSLAVDEVIARLKKLATKKTLEGMTRYGIPNDKAFGVSVKDLRDEAKRIGNDHKLAQALWKTGWYEARMLACFLAVPAEVTPKEMDRWCKDFDSWAICDTACFHLFDRTPHAFDKIAEWAPREEEFIRRAAFALIASVVLHQKKAEDDLFLECIPLIEAAATDDRNFVKKGVSWALRGIGHRSKMLHQAACSLAERLATSTHATERWIGKDVLRDLQRAKVLKKAEGKKLPSSIRSKS